MKRHLLVALAVLTLMPGAALAQMMDRGMMEQSMMPGMMGKGMMPGMMDKGKDATCGCMMDGMMSGRVDLHHLRRMLALTDEQAERLRAVVRPFQKEAILNLAALKVAEIELADLLAGKKLDFDKVEARLKEIEGLRTKSRLAHVKATVAVKGILTPEQQEKLQEAGEHAPPPPAPGAAPKAAPPADAGHDQHH